MSLTLFSAVSISHHSLSKMTWLHMHMIIFLNYYRLQNNHPYLIVTDWFTHDNLTDIPSVSAIARLDLKLCIMDLILIHLKPLLRRDFQGLKFICKLVWTSIEDSCLAVAPLLVDQRLHFRAEMWHFAGMGVHFSLHHCIPWFWQVVKIRFG